VARSDGGREAPGWVRSLLHNPPQGLAAPPKRGMAAISLSTHTAHPSGVADSISSRMVIVSGPSIGKLMLPIRNRSDSLCFAFPWIRGSTRRRRRQSIRSAGTTFDETPPSPLHKGGLQGGCGDINQISPWPYPCASTGNGSTNPALSATPRFHRGKLCFRMEFFIPRCGARFDEDSVPLEKGGLQRGFEHGNKPTPALRDRRRFAPPPLLRGNIFGGRLH
jgi:hypothetical protein